MRKLSLWLPVAAWCAMIFVFSSIPNLSSGLEYDYPLRKLCHVLEYGVLFALTRRAIGAGSSWKAAVFCVLYACSDEWHQTFVFGRHGCVGDVLIDSAGVLAWWTFSSWAADRTRHRRDRAPSRRA